MFVRKGREIHLDVPAFFLVCRIHSQISKGLHMKTMIFIWQALMAYGQSFYRTTIAPDNDGKPLPPIRYDGDPNDIYLA